MALTGGLFVAVVVLVAAAATAGCGWLLPRSRDRLAARLGLVAGCQLCLLLAVLVAVNSYFDFYSSFHDLAGDPSGTVRVVEPANQTGAPTTTAITPARDIRAPLPSTGRLEAVLIHGRRSGVTLPAYVYLPVQPTRQQRLPAVLVLTDDDHALAARLPDVVAQQVAAKSIQPTAYVIMNARSGCVDVPGGTHAETFFAEDVPAALAATYRVSPDAHAWGVYGDAGGGYCAAALAMRHGDQFPAAVSTSGDYAAPNLGNAAIRDENDILWRLRHRPPPPVNLLLVTSPGHDARDLLPLVRPPMRVETASSAALPGLLQWLNARLSP